MTQTTRYYESKLPMTHRELYDLAETITIRELIDRDLEYNRPWHSSTISLLAKYHGGRINFHHPKESDVPIEISANSKFNHKYLKRGLKRLLKFELKEIPQEVTV